MVKIGDRELVFTATLILGDDETADLQVPVRDVTLPIKLRFVGGDSPQQTGHWRTVDGVLHMEFAGWLNPLGSAFDPPERIGDVGGAPLWFQMAHHRIVSVNLVHLLILVGEAAHD